LRVENDRINAAVPIDIAERQSRRRNSQAPRHLVHCKIAEELLILLESAIALVEIHAGARSGPLLLEKVASKKGNKKVQGYDIRQPVTVQVHCGKIKGIQRSGREEMEYRGTEHPLAISSKVSQFECGEGHPDDNIQIPVPIKVVHCETLRDTGNVELALRTKCAVAVAEQESHGPAIGFSHNQVQFFIVVHVHSRQSCRGQSF